MYLNQYQILIVDDEPDIFMITKLALRDLSFQGQVVEMASANSAQEAKDYLLENPSTALILLDVVMESTTAGLDFCKWLREDANNHLTRVVLRTGQPGSAPEKQVIDEYEIDGYLAKSEMTKTRLYSAVKTGLKTFSELYRSQALEVGLSSLHELVFELNSMGADDKPALLQKITERACVLSGSPLTLFYLKRDESDDNYLLYSCTDPDIIEPQAEIEAIIKELNNETPDLPGSMLHLPLTSGEGWFYFDNALQDDPIAQKILPMMAAHTAQVFEK